MLNINKQAENGKLVIALEGRLDTTTSPVLEVELKSSLDGVTELIMDFEKLEYISSAGLRVLLSAQKTMNNQGSMKVIHVNETIMEIFEVTGFSDILTVESEAGLMPVLS
jgi:anti-sigma B factor antagonist